MKTDGILFDLDGMLLPMDQDEFTKGYFKLLAKNLAAHGGFDALADYCRRELSGQNG